MELKNCKLQISNSASAWCQTPQPFKPQNIIFIVNRMNRGQTPFMDSSDPKYDHLTG